jgi:uncharacterized protein YgiM (DUF1202 family)
MQNDEYETVGTDPVFRVVRMIVPWIALALVLWALAGVWSGFQRSKQVAESTAANTGPVVATPTVSPSVATTVTGMTAVTRVDLGLRSQESSTSAVLVTVKKGATLTILAKADTWFKVKDAAGHIGWIPNDVKVIDVRLVKKK